MSMLFLLRPPASLVDFFVDEKLGIDSNDGRLGNPWKTLNKVATSTFSPGDIIAFRRGEVWREAKFIFPSSGVGGNPITLTAYGSGNDPEFNGSDIITGWTLHSGSVWKATVTSEPRGWWFDGTKGTNLTSGSDPVPGGNSTLLEVDSTGDWFYDGGLNLLYIFSSGGDPDSVFTTVEATNRAATMQISGKSWINVEKIKFSKADFQGLTIDNSCSNVNLTSCIAEFNQGDGFDIRSGSGDMTVLNCTADDNGIIRGFGLSVSNSGHGLDMETDVHDVVIDGLIANGNAEQAVQTKVDTGANITIQNGTFKDHAEAGVGLKGGKTVIIQDNVLDNSGSTGRAVPTATGSSGSVGIINVGVNQGATTYSFLRNRITGFTRVAIWHSTTNVALGTLKIHSNILHDNDGYGIWLQDEDTGLTYDVIHNTLYKCGKDTFHKAFLIQGDFAALVLKNNNVESDVSGSEALDYYPDKSLLTEQNNNWFVNAECVQLRDGSFRDYNVTEVNDGTYTSAESLGQNSIALDPTLNDPASLDFTPKVGSPVIAAGQSSTGVTVDFDGNPFASPPNMGCFSGSV